MAFKQSKLGKKEQSTKADVGATASDDFNMAILAVQLEEHRNAISADFKVALSSLEAKLDLIQTTVSGHTHAINLLESNANDQDERIQHLESVCARPRPVVIRLHRFQQKEKIIREARAKRGKLRYRGTPIAIYEDYPSEIVEQRRDYREVMSELYQRGFKLFSTVVPYEAEHHTEGWSQEETFLRF